VSAYCYLCPHTTICVLILLSVSSYYYMCPHTSICVLILLSVSAYYYLCPHTSICVRILLSVSSYYYLWPHTTMSMSDIYYTICVLMLVVQVLFWPPPRRLHMCPHTCVCGYICVLIHVQARCAGGNLACY
jgi:hypothetical protein